MSKKMKMILGLLLLAVLITGVILYLTWRGGGKENMQAVKPFRGDIQVTVSTIGTVEPQNRLEIKPPINGRVEKILVVEGQKVKIGEVLALMSSTERATLIDAARLKGEAEFKYWQNAYKETPLVAPINGEVIVRDVEPGQTVTTGEAILVLSDRLIVEADVDETDIGEIKLGQEAMISLDAYPDIKIDAVVDHISYESEIVNNVTIYNVDILPKEVPEVFRSGMSANVEVVVEEAKNVLLIPATALQKEGEQTLVYVRDEARGGLKKIPVKTGLANDGSVQIVSGLQEGQEVFIRQDLFVMPKKNNGSNPFLPSFRRRRDEQKK